MGKTLGGKLIQNCDEFALALLSSAQVAAVPGSAFGTPGYIRVSYATSMENITKGMDRLEEFLKG
jgi:aspartate aminotransferase